MPSPLTRQFASSHNQEDLSRRRFMRNAGIGIAWGSVAAGQGPHVMGNAPTTTNRRAQIRGQTDDHVTYHHARPYDYGVMRGPIVPENLTVSKDPDKPTFWMAGQKRLIWTQQNMGVLQRTATIARGGEILPLEPHLLDVESMEVEDSVGRAVTVGDWINAGWHDGFAVVYLSKRAGPLIAIEKYFNGMDPHRLHYLWSTSKSLSAGVVAHAFDQKRLRRDTRIVDVLPELADSGYRNGATMDHVLRMEGGIRYYTDPANKVDSFGMFVRQNRAAGFLAGGEVTDDPKGCLPFIAQMQHDRAAGAYFSYNNPDSRVAVAAAERVMGNRPFAELFSELIWSKIGAEHDATVVVDQPHGNAITPHGMSTTLRDLARWGLAHLPNSPRQAIPQDFVQDTLKSREVKWTKNSALLQTPLMRRLHVEEGGYHNLYWTGPFGPTCGLAGGGWFGQACAVAPHVNVVISQFGSCLGDPNQPVPQGPAYLRIAEHVARAYQAKGL